MMKVLFTKWTTASAVIAIVSGAVILLLFGFPTYFSRIFPDKPITKQSRADKLKDALELAYDLRYNGTTNRIILAGGISGGLFKSFDDGASWVRKSPSGDLFAGFQHRSFRIFRPSG